MKLEKIVTRQENFADWYTSVITAANLVLYSDIKGMMIFQPNGWTIWQNIKNELDKRMQNIGIKNVQLPLFIKHSEFIKEKQHVEGFAPELFMVNKKGDENLEDPYVIRPTSEIAFCNYFKQVITSYNSLPIKYNQWCNVFRVEKNTRPFLRNSEFFWQELHTAHSDRREAYEQALQMINLYKNFVNYFLCIPVIMGEKTIGERFAGAQNTFTIEAIMQDGQMLQCGTSHYLGQNFAKPYEIKFQSKNNDFQYIHQTSAGVSTRLIGAIIMSHSDDKGLVLPMGVAFIQIAILPILSDKDPKVNSVCKELEKKLSKYRVYVDYSNNGMGYKIASQEVNGTPITIVVGPNDIASNSLILIRRDDNIKQTFPINNIKNVIEEQFKIYQQNIYSKALNRLNSSIVEVSSMEQFNQAIKDKKIAMAYWGGNIDDEKKLKQETGASPRCIFKKIDDNIHKCFYSNKQAMHIVYFARAY